ncbi:uncharacterized protein LOC122508527 [Leptopilina heterotoma]|uniref:uncharacterized protein LOC122508527 n=1 Tax=Leptopilina heterotoma TaxID=63436 RepID=UPI001CA922D4|nr:uncharacterized protein LOC122508527 [Leptopilina heterotoma]
MNRGHLKNITVRGLFFIQLVALPTWLRSVRYKVHSVAAVAQQFIALASCTNIFASKKYIYLRKGKMIFDRDYSKVPCIRQSFLNGIGAGVIGLVAVLMMTSKPRLAANCCIGAFVTVSPGSFVYCQYKLKKTKDLLMEAKIRAVKSE